ncbi:hypothetical protein ACFY6U_21745 [Streptomyces sp. NPDC013157]|uniref:hypothetical protein n=1 Tax=Streptomyces sp. NPDC013157 TaxID=3364861 RepID=UPI003698671D
MFARKSGQARGIRARLRGASVVLAAIGVVIGFAEGPAAAADNWTAVADPDSSRWFDAFLANGGDTVFARSGSYPGGDAGSGEVARYWQRNGTTWTLLPAISSQTVETNDDDVWTATSANDFWVVGQTAAAATVGNHWNGTAWEQRSPTDTTVRFLDIKAVSANDVWAVGTTRSSSASSLPGTIGHWTGSGWQVTKVTPTTGSQTELTSVYVKSASDIWAAGETCTAVGGSNCRGYVTHYDGTSWKEVAVPTGTVGIEEITAGPSGEVWAAAGTKVLRWTGSAWTGGADVSVSGAYAIRELTWAGGKLYAGLGLGSANSHSGILRWTGTAWEQVTRVPETTGYYVTNVYELSGAPDGTLWAAGSYAQLFATPTFAATLAPGS